MSQDRLKGSGTFGRAEAGSGTIWPELSQFGQPGVVRSGSGARCRPAAAERRAVSRAAAGPERSRCRHLAEDPRRVTEDRRNRPEPAKPPRNRAERAPNAPENKLPVILAGLACLARRCWACLAGTERRYIVIENVFIPPLILLKNQFVGNHKKIINIY